MPRRSVVLIYDACNQHLFFDYSGQWKPAVLHVRGEEINVPVLIASLFSKGKISDAYTDSYIRAVSPRLIVTFVDNTPAFYYISLRHPNVKTLFVQNGIRGYYFDSFESLDKLNPGKGSLRVDYMLTNGSAVGDEYARYIDGNVIPIGSLINNQRPKRRAKNAGTIAYISQYRISNGLEMAGRFITKEDFWSRTDRSVLSFLLKYADANGKRLFIIPSITSSKTWYTKEDIESERRHYAELLGHSFEYFECDELYSCYDAVDSAEVVVGADSTLVFESAVRGNKTAVFSVRGHFMGIKGYSYGWPGVFPNQGPFWTNLPDEVAYQRILDHLFAIDEAQWSKELANNDFEKVMAVDLGNSVLRGLLQKELGSSARAVD